jgi:chemotaxis protein methyltransferase CheR
MTDQTAEFDFIRELVYREAAIVLNESKNYLIEARLSPIARRVELETIGELVAKLKRGDKELQERVVEALTTNETSFFRDAHPFEALATEILPTLARARAEQRTLRIWSAASSTGQEAYTIAMVILSRVPQLANWTIRILGTDIADGVLAQAREGRYAQLEVNRGLPAAMLSTYFERHGIAWRVTPEVRKLVEFQQLNLIRPWPPSFRFDVIFLRNVLIYFDTATKQTILERVLRALTPDGYLFVGGSEMISTVHDGFIIERAGQATWYRPRTATTERLASPPPTNLVQ